MEKVQLSLYVCVYILICFLKYISIYIYIYVYIYIYIYIYIYMYICYIDLLCKIAKCSPQTFKVQWICAKSKHREKNQALGINLLNRVSV
jgi:hypothetical protein